MRAILRTPSFTVPTWHLPAAAVATVRALRASISCAVVYILISVRRGFEFAQYSIFLSRTLPTKTATSRVSAVFIAHTEREADSHTERKAEAERKNYGVPMSEMDAHWNICRNSTMVPRFNAGLAYNAVKRVNEDKVAGDVVELGVWQGGQSCFMALAQKAYSTTPRRFWLYDTFEGMPAPTADDDRRSRWYYRRITNGTAKHAPGGIRDGKWAYAPMDEVRRVVARTGLPDASFRFVKGKVEDTLRDTSLPFPSEIALLRLDTDWYESTKVELDVLWPRLSPGGWMYVDDYSAFGGAKKAVDRWLKLNGWTEHARKANAFLRGAGRPREGCAEDRLGSFAVWKARDGKHVGNRSPFETRPRPAWCAGGR